MSQVSTDPQSFTVVNRIAVPDKQKNETLYEPGQVVSEDDLGKVAKPFLKSGDIAPLGGDAAPDGESS